MLSCQASPKAACLPAGSLWRSTPLALVIVAHKLLLCASRRSQCASRRSLCASRHSLGASRRLLGAIRCSLCASTYCNVLLDGFMQGYI